jgi:hypothetical protein
MIRINELKRKDREQFFSEIIEQHGVDHAISCVRDNDRLSSCLVFHKTGNESYWVNLYANGYPREVEMTMREIEEKLNLVPGTLKILPF